MEDNKTLNYISDVLAIVPNDWLNLTTHRLDIYNEELAKTEFLAEFEVLFKDNNSELSALDDLKTAYDYIRLGHPLSCVLEWTYAKLNDLDAENIISFSSKVTPILAILRKNLLDKKNTQIIYSGDNPPFLDAQTIKDVYGYNFDLKQQVDSSEIPSFDGSTIFITQQDDTNNFDLSPSIDFYLNIYPEFGSIVFVNGEKNNDYVSEIQHVRRRETIAMTPPNCLTLLQIITKQASNDSSPQALETNKVLVQKYITEVTAAPTKPLIGSSGLSIQYAISMGLIQHANEYHIGKEIKFVVPPNCYGGTNDQARRIAACLDHVEVVDLLVDDGQDMVQSLNKVLSKIAEEDAVPYIIAEIPTNPRVEVPDLNALKNVLSQSRKTKSGELAIDPVFILDQTFCPNVHFLGDGNILSTVRAISYASGSKFPSGGRCNAGYCVGNKIVENLIEKIEWHLKLCDNEATSHQLEILAEQMPTMTQRINDAYQNTREFVSFIQETLPAAKINFVSEELAAEGFTPSVFSLNLPTKGETEEEKEKYKRALNLKLIHLMISEIPEESKFCVSYGQLKGCYWTVPATSTQGTTKEGDKDYIVRASLSPKLDLELHKKVFKDFVERL